MVNLRKVVDPSAWNQVVTTAQALQEQQDLPFGRGNLIYKPQRDYPYVVHEVLDNRRRIGAGLSIDLLCSSEGEGERSRYLKANEVLHLGYFFQAAFMYDRTILAVSGIRNEEVLARLAIVLANLQ